MEAMQSTFAPAAWPKAVRARKPRATALQSWRRSMKRANTASVWARTRRSRALCSPLGAVRR